MLASATRLLSTAALALAISVLHSPTASAQAAVSLPACDATRTIPTDALDVSHRRFDKVREYSVVASAQKKLPGMTLESITLFAAESDEAIPQGAIDGFSSLAVAAKIEFGGITALDVEFLYRDTKANCLARAEQTLQLEGADNETGE